MSNLSVDPDVPSLDWPEADLMVFLAKAWGMADPQHIRVQGWLRVEGAGHGFIENLHDAVTGVKLPSMKGPTNLPIKIFVSPPALISFHRRWGSAQHVVAELTLARLERREQRNEPLACIAIHESIVALTQVPETWGTKFFDDDGRALMLSVAREAIESQLQQETNQTSTQLEQLRREFAAELKHQAAERQDHLLKQHQFSEEIERSNDALIALRKDAIEIQAQFDLRRERLENKLRDLTALIRQRGERMIALDLIDREDLDSLVPPVDDEDAREGHDYQQVLGGEFARLAPFIQARLWKRGMLFSQEQLRDFLALMRTHDLVVLAGDSGSGKTSLVKAVSESIGGRCTVIPVKPNWTGPEDLLGYYNPIERSYQATTFLKALQAAEREPKVPHFICLDEMNLARVEHYFADFLSLLETRDSSPTIPLYTSTEEHHVVVEHSLFLALEEEARQRSGVQDGATFTDLLKNQQANALLHELGGFRNSESVLLHHGRLRRSMGAILQTPPSIQFPSNLRIIGAINIDETTHYLSPKVLDRAHVLRFRNPVLMDWDAIESEVEEFGLDLELPVCLSADDLGNRGGYPAFDRSEKSTVLLTQLARDYLDPLGVEFGLRAIRQSLGYLQAARMAGMDDLSALDRVVQHKILPKLMFDAGRTGVNGLSKRDILVKLRDVLQEALEGLGSVAGDETSIVALDRLIGSIDGNNGIANYWHR